MTHTNYADFITVLTNVVETTPVNQIKATIGDSTHNHRVPSINQVIRFLKNTRRAKLAHQLRAVYAHLQHDIRINRLTSNSRTDAYDINEFFDSFDFEVISGSTNDKRTVTTIINSL